MLTTFVTSVIFKIVMVQCDSLKILCIKDKEDTHDFLCKLVSAEIC